MYLIGLTVLFTASPQSLSTVPPITPPRPRQGFKPVRIANSQLEASSDTATDTARVWCRLFS
jgi:hypothetical protein